MTTSTLNKQHPLLLAYDQTFDRDFPLILIIGREPNNGSCSNGHIGLYDFKAYPGRAFWNVGFSIFGRLNNYTCKQIKAEFTSRRSSPIVFADAFANGILNGVTSKFAERLVQSTSEKAAAQVSAILSHVEVLKRVKLVLFCGLNLKSNNMLFQNFTTLFKQHLENLGIPYHDTPFLYPTNTKNIMNCLTETHKDLVKGICKEFKKETDLLPVLTSDKLGKYELDAPGTELGIIMPSGHTEFAEADS